MCRKRLKQIFKYSMLFAYGGMLYVCVELLFRQRSDVTMMFCGGLAFVGIGLINNVFSWNMSLIKQCLIGGLGIVTPLEYIFGIIFNRDYHIWDYRDQMFNIDGHVCLLFSILWCFIALVAIFLDDFLRWLIFDDEKPHYKI